MEISACKRRSIAATISLRLCGPSIASPAFAAGSAAPSFASAAGMQTGNARQMPCSCPPDALQLRARCYLRAPASAVSDWASNSAPPSTLHVAMQRTLTRVVQIFSVALFLYIISTTVHSHINCPLCPRPPLQYPLTQPQLLLVRRARPCGGGRPGRRARGGKRSRASALHSHSSSAGRTRLGLLRRVHRQRPRIVHRLGLGTPHPQCCWAAHLPSTSEASRLRTWSSTYDVAANFAGSTEKSHWTHGTPEAAPHVW